MTNSIIVAWLLAVVPAVHHQPITSQAPPHHTAAGQVHAAVALQAVGRQKRAKGDETAKAAERRAQNRPPCAAVTHSSTLLDATALPLKSSKRRTKLRAA